MSVRWPVIAAAAAITGETRCVRPPRPCRPSKLRLLVEAQRSPGLQDIRVHAEAHAAAWLTPLESRGGEDGGKSLLARPASLPAATPGTTIARTVVATCRPSTTFAAARRSSMRAFVQEPRKTRIDADLFDPRSRLQVHVFEGARESSCDPPPTAHPQRMALRRRCPVTIPGLVPQVTRGASVKPHRWSSRDRRSRPHL